MKMGNRKLKRLDALGVKVVNSGFHKPWRRMKFVPPTPGPVGRMTRAIRRGNVVLVIIKPERELLYMNSHARAMHALRTALDMRR